METNQSQNKNNRDQDQDMSLDINIHTDGKPIHVIRCGNIKAACWLNDGMSGRFFSTGIVRVYRDKSKQEWGQSHAFTDTRDLLTVAYVRSGNVPLDLRQQAGGIGRNGVGR